MKKSILTLAIVSTAFLSLSTTDANAHKRTIRPITKHHHHVIKKPKIKYVYVTPKKHKHHSLFKISFNL